MSKELGGSIPANDGKSGSMVAGNQTAAMKHAKAGGIPSPKASPTGGSKFSKFGITSYYALLKKKRKK